MARAALVLIAVVWVLSPAGAAAAPPWLREIPENARGRENFERGDFAEAAKNFEKAGEPLEGDDKGRSAFNQGDALYKSGRFDEAYAAFGNASRAADGDLRADAHFNRGLAAEGRNDVKAAIEAYQNALLENPRHDPARVNLEQLLLRPPPPPQPQQSSRNDSQKSKDENESDQPQPAPNAPADEPPPSPKPQSGEAQESGKLTEEEAESILRSAEREQKTPRLLQSGEPPPDYDPKRDW